MKRIALALIVCGVTASSPAAQLLKVDVGGEDRATVRFHFDDGVESPRLEVKEGTVELLFPNVQLKSALGEKLEMQNPHALLGRIVALPTERGLRTKLFVQGSPEGLRDRIQWAKQPGVLELLIEFPAGAKSTLKLLQQENKPWNIAEANKKPTASGFSWLTQLGVAVLFILMAVAGFFFLRFLRKKTSFRGPRKFLIENMAYCPIGQGGKVGVALMKVGTEFVLVGVSPNQVTFLSSLPKLESQYQEENRFERETFQEAVQQEVRSQKTRTRTLLNT